MRHLTSFLLCASLMAVAPAAASPRVGGEERLAKILHGRAPGVPVPCIDLQRVQSTEIIDNTAIVYDAGNTLYVNRPTAGLTSLNRSDAMVSKPMNRRLCNVDVVRTLDTSLGMTTGSIFLGDFVPYERVR